MAQSKTRGKRNDMSRYSLRFEKEVEREYNSAIISPRLSKLRLSILFGIAMMLIFAVIEYIVSSSLGLMSFALNVSVVLSLFILLLIATYNKNISKYLSYLLMVFSIFISIAYFFRLSYLSTDALSKIFLLPVVYLIYLVSMLRADLIQQIVSVFTASLLYAYTFCYLNPVDANIKVITIVTVVFINVLGAYYVYSLEYLERNNFVLSTEKKAIKKRYKDVKVEYEELIYKSERTSTVQKKTAEMPKKVVIEPIEQSERDILYKKYKKDREKAASIAMSMIFNALPEIVCVITADGIIKHASPKFSQLIISDSKATLDNKFQQYLNKLDMERFEMLLKTGINNSDLLKNSFSIKNSEGKYNNVYMRIGRFKSFDKNMYYILSMTLEEVTPNVLLETASAPTISREDEKAIMSIYEKLKTEYKNLDDKYLELLDDNKKLNTKNSMLMTDLDKLRARLKVMAIEKDTEEATKNVDEIRIMNRIATYYSDYIARCQRELIKILENSFMTIAELHDRDFVENYYSDNKRTMLTSLYQAGAVKFRIDMYEYVLNYVESQRTELVNVRNLIQTSLTKLARYFEYTENMIEVSCPNDIVIKSKERPIELIMQNFVITSLYLILSERASGQILINVRDEKSKIIIEYKDNGKPYEPYYYELINFDKIDSNILSVNGIEFYLASKIVKKEYNGSIDISREDEYNVVKIMLYK